jgi:glycosyltransferase involved in cell wall biosynthesis
MTVSKPLRVCIDARIPDGPASGARAVVFGLAAALSSLKDGDEEYLFLVNGQSHRWLLPHLQGPCSILKDKTPAPSSLKKIVKSIPFVSRLANTFRQPPHAHVPAFVPPSDGTIEEAKIDVMHFLQPSAFLTSITNIYQIHDLQHRHFPQFFAAESVKDRDFTYKTCSDQADMVAVMTESGRQDAIEAYDLPPQKVSVIPWAPVFDVSGEPAPNDLTSTKQKYKLPDKFIFFPAHTWAHKNHETLLEALVYLKEKRNLEFTLVCSGRTDDYYPAVQEKIRLLNLTGRVHFLGYVSALELSCLYRLAECLVYPSLFEGWGLPLLEAAAAGTPVVCSNISPLQEQIGEAAILFDPMSVEQIADALETIRFDLARRETLIALGFRRLLEFSWERTALLLRSHYRRLGKRADTVDDIGLPSAKPLV